MSMSKAPQEKARFIRMIGGWELRFEDKGIDLSISERELAEMSLQILDWCRAEIPTDVEEWLNSKAKGE